MNRRLILRVLLIVTFAAGMGTTAKMLWTGTPDSREVRDHAVRPEHGPEILAVYIGSSECAASKRDELPGTINEAMKMVNHYASHNGLGFTSHGIAVDLSSKLGLNHLNRIGAFDQLTVGRGWANIAARRFVWGDLGGVAAIPQLVVVYRELRAPTKERPHRTYAIRDAQLVKRLVGYEEISRWAAQGAPLSVQPVGSANNSGEVESP